MLTAVSKQGTKVLERLESSFPAVNKCLQILIWEHLDDGRYLASGVVEVVSAVGCVKRVYIHVNDTAW